METEHDSFEEVRKLLTLKRYEQPPPRYFEEFSNKVLSRIQAGEAAQPVTWRQRLGLDFDFKPAMMGACGVVVCALLLVGVIASSGVSQPANAGFSMANDPSALFAPSIGDTAFAGGTSFNRIAGPEETASSTMPAASSTSPFDQITPHAQRAAFTFGADN